MPSADHVGRHRTRTSDAHSAIQRPIVSMKPGWIEDLLLIDPELGNSGGHYQSYADTLRRACGQLGIGFSALGGRGSTAPAFDPINARFVPQWLGGALVNPFLGGWRMERQIRAHANARVSSRTLVFAATANHRHYAALGRWLENIDEQMAPKLSVLLRFPQYDSRRGRWYATAHLTRRGLASLGRAARRRDIRLVADSEGLAAEYRQLTTLPVTALPIPHMLSERRPRPQPGRITRIGYFGEARREKGFECLVQAIEILGKADHCTPFELVVQSYVRAGFEEQGAAAACARLGTARFANVRVLEGSLDTQRFYDEFLACDAVLMPYVVERYRTRNSGVFADALAAGIAVVVTRGTWMQEQLAQGFGAGLTIPEGDAAALAGAIVEIAQRREEMTQDARASAANWCELHDPVGFVGALADLFGFEAVTADTV